LAAARSSSLGDAQVDYRDQEILAMIRSVRSYGAACAAAVSLLTACSDSTGPKGEPFDPARAEADLAVLGTLMGNQQLAAFTAMSAYFDLSGASSAAISSARALVSSGTTSPATVRRMTMSAAEGLALRTSAGGAPSFEVLPTSVLGTTFVFDPQATRTSRRIARALRRMACASSFTRSTRSPVRRSSAPKWATPT
jgi:hypothetical protein